ncbi:hypothetical protein N7509_001781 [Penicillium cosmopolitanum]|uniref:Uncharacterized protein n=1 Tax=Penicillium cosmopolitanum TaxID=1131564 RepID=A0A9W9W7T0_9EURO|nr:uncharacterized protein N7509_001781 [Penicillium cosmopolitanum]KAJ5407898.1 hypothetical protein N7509_001781 [Penicillium cosmopolitanum]
MDEHHQLEDCLGVPCEKWSSVFRAATVVRDLADIAEQIEARKVSEKEITCENLRCLLLSVATIFYGVEEYDFEPN